MELWRCIFFTFIIISLMYDSSLYLLWSKLWAFCVLYFIPNENSNIKQMDYRKVNRNKIIQSCTWISPECWMTLNLIVNILPAFLVLRLLIAETPKRLCAITCTKFDNYEIWISSLQCLAILNNQAVPPSWKCDVSSIVTM
jgi:hypothetical protein